MPVQKLDVKPTEFKIATEHFDCDVCGKTVEVGFPYVIKRRISIADGSFAITLVQIRIWNFEQKKAEHLIA
jgi:hypothetical protein